MTHIPRSVRLCFLALLALFAAAPLPVLGASSGDNRDDSVIHFGVSPIGAHNSTLFAPPVTVAFHLGRNVMIGLEYGAMRTSGDFVFVESVEDTTLGDLLEEPVLHDPLHTSGGIYIRWFVRNSFFLMAAMHRRTWQGDVTVSFEDDGGFAEEANGAVETAATVGSVGLGNLWTFDSGFTLGATWGVLSGVSGSSTAVTLKNGSGFSATERQAAIKEMQRFADELVTISGSSGFAILHLGWSF